MEQVLKKQKISATKSTNPGKLVEEKHTRPLPFCACLSEAKPLVLPTGLTKRILFETKTAKIVLHEGETI